MKGLNITELENVSGGEIEGTEYYDEGTAIRSGNLYNPSNIRQVVGTITAGQKLKVHPEFRYIIDGVAYCAVEISKTSYITEWDNISLG